ncbi:MAG: lipopolysaccharide transport periplasmic protein LptA [Azoarcus sp.]|jgi:lipopolysaccharide export system protein LptA|nr:lipopolysaccharide transport periplasmic protein LptA [Azoarcus sp.]
MQLFLAASTVLLLAAMPAYGQLADRSQPINIDADRVAVDDRNKVHVFEGNVVLTQGTLTLKGDKIVITQNTAGFYNGVATAQSGKLVTFRQKRVNDGTWIDGEAERIEYNNQIERAKLFNQGRIRNAGNMVRGQYIEYDIATESYFATDSPERSGAGKQSPEVRVTVTLQPKSNKTGPTDAKPR